MVDDRQRIELPNSAAIISLSRVQGDTTLYGTEIQAPGYVRLRISPAQEERSIHRTWRHAGNRPHIDVAMTYSQFAQAITTMNGVENVPCTVHYLKGEKMEPIPPRASEEEMHSEELTEEVQEILNQVNELIAAIQEEKMAKKAQTRLIGIAQGLLTQIKSNVPYIVQSYQEALGGLTQTAKTEIASYAEMTAHHYGRSMMIQEGQNGHAVLTDNGQEPRLIEEGE